MNKKNLTVSVLLLGSSILLVSTLHFLTPVDSLVLHQIYQRLYYIPIILAALWYGWRGGLGAASLASASYVPHIALHWQHQNYDYALNQYAEITLFFVIGAVTGWLGDQKRREHERAAALNAELQKAYSICGKPSVSFFKPRGFHRLRKSLRAWFTKSAIRSARLKARSKFSKTS
jgi:glucose-6-phosphate-specific signal transduction histidine kinase